MKKLLIYSAQAAPVLYVAIIISVILAFLSILIGESLYSSYIDATSQYAEKAFAINHYLDIEEIDGLFINPDSVSEMKQAYNIISTSELFKYFDIHTQPLDFLDYTGAEKFDYGYEHGIDTTQLIQLSSGEKEITSIKSCQLNCNAFELYNFVFSEGRPFLESDYTFLAGKEIPVILGSEYSEYYSINDTLKCSYLTQNITAKVVGILAKDSYITRGSETLFVDRYIIMPMCECLDEPQFGTDYYNFQCMHYINKLCGCFYVDPSVSNSKMTSIINKMIDGILPVQIKVWEIANPVTIGSLNMESGYHARIIKVSGYVIAVFFYFILCFLIVLLKKKTAYLHEAFIISGANPKMNQLGLFALAELAVFFGIVIAAIVCLAVLRSLSFSMIALLYFLLLIITHALQIFGEHNFEKMLHYLQTEAEI